MTVSWILKEKGRHVVAALPDTSLAEIVKSLARNRIGAVVITDADHRIAGIISERDIVGLLAENGPAILSRPVSEVMTKPVLTCSDHHSVDWVMGEMSKNRFRHMPVVDKGRLTGIISIGDVVKFKLAMAEAEADQMRQYIATG
jgi:CBS domain-containing protein